MKKKLLAPILLSLAVLVWSFTTISPPDTYTVDTGTSTFKWTGYHIAKSYEHYGFVKLKSGNLEIDNGDIVSGSFIIDMTTISNKDLEKAKDNEKLVKDLKSERFFNVKEFPEASLKIKNVSKSADGVYDAKADITIRGITEEISFVTKKVGQDDNSIKFTASLQIDRTKHEVMHGWSVENVILGNNFDLQVELVAKKVIN